jgi:thymidylate synthase
LDEGVQERIPMPPMPYGDPWPSVQTLVQAEQEIRLGRQHSYGNLDPYWSDFVRLLEVYRYSRNATQGAQPKKINELKKQMSSPVYDTHILKRHRRALKQVQPTTPMLFNPDELDALQTGKIGQAKR